jgi:hypothetical protein
MVTSATLLRATGAWGTPYPLPASTPSLALHLSALRIMVELVNKPAGKGYTRYNYFAETLEELEQKLGVHGPSAVAVVRWAAVSLWLRRSWPEREREGLLSNTYSEAGRAVRVMKDADRTRFDYPRSDGKSWSCPLEGLPPEDAAAVRRIAEQTVADWERAGSPGLHRPDRIKQEQQYVMACVAAQKRQREAAAQEI